MKKIKSFLKKHWFINAIILLSVLRFLFTYKLPSFYIFCMGYDDALMMRNLKNLILGNYLGGYGKRTLIKGPMFSFVLFIIRIYKLSYSSAFTLLYIIACIYFIYSLKYIIKNKKYLIIIFVILLFNPVTYSQDLFERLYRNSISIIELLFFLGTVIRLLFGKKNKVYKYIGFGYNHEFDSSLEITDTIDNSENSEKSYIIQVKSNNGTSENVYYKVKLNCTQQN